MDKFVCYVLLTLFVSGIVSEKNNVRLTREQDDGQYISSTSGASDDLATPAPVNILKTTGTGNNPIFHGQLGSARQSNSYSGAYVANKKYSNYQSSGEDDGSYKPHLYGGGQYSHDGLGNYQHQDNKYVHDANPYVHDKTPYVHNEQYIHGQTLYRDGQYNKNAQTNQNSGYSISKYQQNQYSSQYGPGGYFQSGYNYPGYSEHNQYSSGYVSGLSGVTPINSAFGHTQISKGHIVSSTPSTISGSISSAKQGSLETVKDKIQSSGLTSGTYFSGQYGAVGGIKSSGLTSGQYETGAYQYQYPGYVNTYQTGNYAPLSYNTLKSSVAPTGYNQYYSGYSSGLSGVTPINSGLLHTQTLKGNIVSSTPSTTSDSVSTVGQGSLETVKDKIQTSALTGSSYSSGQYGVGGIKSSGLTTGQYQTGAYQYQYPGYVNTYQTGYTPISYNTLKSSVAPTGYNQFYSAHSSGLSGVTPINSALFHSQTSKGNIVSSTPSTISDVSSVKQDSLVKDKIQTSGLTSGSFYSGQYGAVGGIKSSGLTSGQYQTGAYHYQYPGHVNTYQTGHYTPLSYNTIKSTPAYNIYSSIVPTTSSVSSTSSKTSNVLTSTKTGAQSSLGSTSGTLETVGTLNPVVQPYIQPGYTSYQSGIYKQDSYKPYNYGDSGVYKQSSQFDNSKYYKGYNQQTYPQTSVIKSTSQSLVIPTNQGIVGGYKTNAYSTYQYPSIQTVQHNVQYTPIGTGSAVTSTAGSGSSFISGSSETSSSSLTSDTSGLSSSSSGNLNSGAYIAGQNIQYTQPSSSLSSTSSSSTGSSLKSGASTSVASSGGSSLSNRISSTQGGAYLSGIVSPGGNIQSGSSGVYDFSSFGKKIAPVTPIHVTTISPLVSQHQSYPSTYFHGYYQQPHGTVNDHTYSQGYYHSGPCGTAGHPGYYGLNQYSTADNRYLSGHGIVNSYPGYTGNLLQGHVQDSLINEPLTGFSSTVSPTPFVEVTTQQS